ncbi:hypothetical protein V6N13_137230 [Hibiscus sabdariffa]|uniref:Chlorophyll a-b binding protein, chloroplastic n=1 Tax=Hibiscus sabdariffa TaxID=183260 RepID=A0ABR2DM35_9ROSI
MFPTFISFQLRPHTPSSQKNQNHGLQHTHELWPSFGANVSHRVSMSADWMPGQPRPPYLDGSAQDLVRCRRTSRGTRNLRYITAECRWAMLAVKLGKGSRMGCNSRWGTLFHGELCLQHRLSSSSPSPSSSTNLAWRKIPRRSAFDPFGYSKDLKKFEELKVVWQCWRSWDFALQQSAYPGTGPLENLATHLADPWHNNIGDIVIPRSIVP